MRPFSLCLHLIPLILLFLLPSPFANAFDEEEEDNEMRSQWLLGDVVANANANDVGQRMPNSEQDEEANQMRAQRPTPLPWQPTQWPTKPPQYPPGRPWPGPGNGKGWGNKPWYGNGNYGKGGGGGGRPNHRSGGLMLLQPARWRTPPTFFPTRPIRWTKYPTFRPRPRPTRRPYVPDIVPQNVIPGMPSSY
ncbi:hypothetical protein niasHT_037396 [Heterodera trifolii]|uniref:Uncharacterized protein n=1 Tax=Heterodera trifolii TaxID=157864 RepID=A0ABD2J4V8_9BILA